MKLNRGRKTHYEAGPNMTPLVDIVMVILIFLMLAGNFGAAEHYLLSNQTISASGVGGVTSASGIEKTVTLDIRVDSPTADRFVATAGRISTSNPAQLTAQLRAMREQFEAAGTKVEDIQVRIGPAGNVKFKYLVQVYEAALDAGLKKVGFARAH